MKKLMASLALTAALVGGGLATTAAPAGASAYGCALWGAKTVGGVTIANGQYCALLAGQNTYVDYVGGGFVAAGNVCNSNVTAEFFDSSGRWYATYSSPVRYGCSRNVTQNIYLRRYVQRGFMCSTLKSNGARVASVCHGIY